MQLTPFKEFIDTGSEALCEPKCCETGDKVIIESGLTVNELLLRNASFTALIDSGMLNDCQEQTLWFLSSYPNYHLQRSS